MRFVLSALVVALAAPATAGTIEGSVVVQGRRGPMRDMSGVVIYLEGGSGRAQATTAEMRMRRKMFEPGVLVVPAGSTVEFPNDDPILHNVFSVSAPNDFDLDLYKRPEVGRHKFAAAGEVKIYCNIHPQMAAVVLVTESAHFTTAGEDGRFRLDGVPPGHYRLKAWHEQAREEAVLEIDVPAQGAAGASLELDASRYRPARHKNKYGKDYDRDAY